LLSLFPKAGNVAVQNLRRLRLKKAFPSTRKHASFSRARYICDAPTHVPRMLP
jgi:hypothetical protein